MRVDLFKEGLKEWKNKQIQHKQTGSRCSSVSQNIFDLEARQIDVLAETVIIFM